MKLAKICLICSAAPIHKSIFSSWSLFLKLPFDRFHVIFYVLSLVFFCEAGLLQMTVHNNVTTNDDYTLGIFSFEVFSGGISTKWVINARFCPTDFLPPYLQAQPVCNLPDFIDIKRLITADEVPADDHDGSCKERTAELPSQEPGAPAGQPEPASGGGGRKGGSGEEKKGLEGWAEGRPAGKASWLFLASIF